MEYSIYNTEIGNLTSAVVRLLEKIYQSKSRCIFFSPFDERIKMVDKTLWTFSTNAFIPHGDKYLGFSEKQPIFFTSEVGSNPNDASVLLMLDSFEYNSWLPVGNFEKIIMMFEGNELFEDSQKIFMGLQKSKENVNYWKQSLKGWEKLS